MINKLFESTRVTCETCIYSKTTHNYDMLHCDRWSHRPKELPMEVFVKLKDNCKFGVLNKEAV
jgi:hypothetical protein